MNSTTPKIAGSFPSSSQMEMTANTADRSAPPNAHFRESREQYVSPLWDIAKKSAVELAATFASVLTYHPGRTLGVNYALGREMKFSVRGLYSGFKYGLLTSHQFVLMAMLKGYFEKQISDRTSQQPFLPVSVAASVAAGLVSAISVTPCEMMALQSQIGAEYRPTLQSLYRAVAPIGLRNAGLSVGMFVLPSFFSEKAKSYVGSHINETGLKILSSIAGGSVAAVATQWAEFARILQQNDVEGRRYPTQYSSWKAAKGDFFSLRSQKLFATRIGVVSIATLVINAAREKLSMLVNGGPSWDE